MAIWIKDGQRVATGTAGAKRYEDNDPAVAAFKKTPAPARTGSGFSNPTRDQIVSQYQQGFKDSVSKNQRVIESEQQKRALENQRRAARGLSPLPLFDDISMKYGAPSGVPQGNTQYIPDDRFRIGDGGRRQDVIDQIRFGESGSQRRASPLSYQDVKNKAINYNPSPMGEFVDGVWRQYEPSSNVNQIDRFGRSIPNFGTSGSSESPYNPARDLLGGTPLESLTQEQQSYIKAYEENVRKSMDFFQRQGIDPLRAGGAVQSRLRGAADMVEFGASGYDFAPARTNRIQSMTTNAQLRDEVQKMETKDLNTFFDDRIARGQIRPVFDADGNLVDFSGTTGFDRVDSATKQWLRELHSKNRDENVLRQYEDQMATVKKETMRSDPNAGLLGVQFTNEIEAANVARMEVFKQTNRDLSSATGTGGQFDTTGIDFDAKILEQTNQQIDRSISFLNEQIEQINADFDAQIGQTNKRFDDLIANRRKQMDDELKASISNFGGNLEYDVTADGNRVLSPASQAYIDKMKRESSEALNDYELEVEQKRQESLFQLQQQQRDAMSDARATLVDLQGAKTDAMNKYYESLGDRQAAAAQRQFEEKQAEAKRIAEMDMFYAKERAKIELDASNYTPDEVFKDFKDIASMGSAAEMKAAVSLMQQKMMKANVSYPLDVVFESIDAKRKEELNKLAKQNKSTLKSFMLPTNPNEQNATEQESYYLSQLMTRSQIEAEIDKLSKDPVENAGDIRTMKMAIQYKEQEGIVDIESEKTGGTSFLDLIRSVKFDKAEQGFGLAGKIAGVMVDVIESPIDVVNELSMQKIKNPKRNYYQIPNPRNDKRIAELNMAAKSLSEDEQIDMFKSEYPNVKFNFVD